MKKKVFLLVSFVCLSMQKMCFAQYYKTQPFLFSSKDSLIVSTFESRKLVNEENNKKKNSEIIFLESHNYNSFEELVRQFKGNIVYIDIWATWCAPCIIEFEHHSTVQKLAENNSVKLLYFSIDRPKHEKKWKKRIIKNSLKGFHIIANQSLQKDMWRKIHDVDYRVSIPYYLIIDKNGKILIKDAPKPSEEEALKNEFMSHK